MSLVLQPLNLDEAKLFVKRHHRHHEPPLSHKFSIGVNDGETVRGVIIIGRPVSRVLDNGWTVEVTRCCTDGAKNAASMLYAAAWRAARSMGYRRLITYTLATEPGTSLIAAGFRVLYKTKPNRSWNAPGRPRVDKHPLGAKLLWEREA